MKLKIRNLVSPLYNKVWHTPKGRLVAKIRKACDDLSRNQRLMVVTILLSAFILAAFFVFGNACYKMGAGHARQSLEIEHIEAIPIQKGLRTISDEKLMDIKIKAYEEMTSEINVEPLDSAAHETD